MMYCLQKKADELDVILLNLYYTLNKKFNNLIPILGNIKTPTIHEVFF